MHGWDQPARGPRDRAEVYREFRVRAGMMGAKEPRHAATQRAEDPRRPPRPAAGRRRPEDGLRPERPPRRPEGLPRGDHGRLPGGHDPGLLLLGPAAPPADPGDHLEP